MAVRKGFMAGSWVLAGWPVVCGQTSLTATGAAAYASHEVTSGTEHRRGTPPPRRRPAPVASGRSQSSRGGWMRRVVVVGVLGVVAVVIAAGCSKDEQASEATTSTSAPTEVSAPADPGTTAKATASSVTTAKPTSTTKPAGSSSTSSSSSSSSSSSTTSSSAVPASVSCGQIAFSPQSGNMATNISGSGVTCQEATNLVRQVAAGHDFYNGPRSFSMGGYSCTETLDPSAVLPTGLYTCTNGTKKVTWAKG